MTTTTTEAPLPCPFCGHVGLHFEDGSTYRWGLASCERCGANCGEVRRNYPDDGAWHADAVKEWNTRSQPQDADMAAPSLQLSADDLKWLERIQDQFADGDGYDAPAETMKRLADLGAIRRTTGSRYTFTSFGMHCLFPDEWRLPLRTHGEYMAEANARLAATRG